MTVARTIEGSAQCTALSSGLQHSGSKWRISLHSTHCGQFILFTHHWIDTPVSSWRNSNKIFALLNLIIRLFNDCLNCRVCIELKCSEAKVGEWKNVTLHQQMRLMLRKEKRERRKERKKELMNEWNTSVSITGYLRNRSQKYKPQTTRWSPCGTHVLGAVRGGGLLSTADSCCSTTAHRLKISSISSSV